MDSLHIGTKKKTDEEKYVIASMEGLEFVKRVENIINRKIIFFYIEAMSLFFFSFDKKYFLLDPTKNKKMTKVENCQNPVENHLMIFDWILVIFNVCQFFFRFETIFFVEAEKKLDIASM